jgi:CheY-like chemotaxis protein
MQMDGYEFVEIIKTTPKYFKHSTIFVTAISDEPKHVNKGSRLFYSSR